MMKGHVSHTTWELWRDMRHTYVGSGGGTYITHNLAMMEGHVSHITWE